MHAWEAIQKTLDYIEMNIGEEIEIEQLAKEASLSVFYYQRLFSRLVKKPVREYIKLRRLARASEQLSEKKERILDIALNFGFHSHQTFTRAFKEAYHMTPEEYRKHPVMLNQFDKPDLLLNYTMIDEGVPLISEGLVVEFQRKTLLHPIPFLGVTGNIPIAGQMPLGEATGIDLPGQVWEKFHQDKHMIHRMKGGRNLGVAYLGDAPEGHFTYFTGAEVAQETQHTSFVRWELPAADYIVCGFEAENFEQLVTVALNKAIKYSALWLEKHEIILDAYAPELYYDDTSDRSYMELWMPISKNVS